MLTAIITAEAIAATIAALVAIHRWVAWRNQAADAHRVAAALDAECIALSGHITRLSARLIKVERQRKAKPGPSKRAEAAALRVATTAKLVREIAR